MMKETTNSIHSNVGVCPEEEPLKTMHDTSACAGSDVTSSIGNDACRLSVDNCDAVEASPTESGSAVTPGHAPSGPLPVPPPEQMLPSLGPDPRQVTCGDTLSDSQQLCSPLCPPASAVKADSSCDQSLSGVGGLTSDPYHFVEEFGDQLTGRISRVPSSTLASPSSSASGNAQSLSQLHHSSIAELQFQFPKKRGRKSKKTLEAMAAAGMEVPKYKSPVRCSDPERPRKKRDRFNGLSDEELFKLTLPDYLTTDLDIVFIGINPGVLSAFKGHHYAGPGDHFWKCIYLAGLIPEPLAAEDDFKLTNFKIGFTNVVARTTKSSQDLTRKELKEGGKILLNKLQKFQPKIAVFNGKGIFEIFSGKKDFLFGKQPEKIEGTQTNIWVMPSSSARCAQLPRALDKVPFFVALRKFRDYLNGHLPELNESEITFQPPKKPTPVRQDIKQSASDGQSSLPEMTGVTGSPNMSNVLPPMTDADGLTLTVPIKKKRGRPRKIKLDENGQPLPDKPKSGRRSQVNSSTAVTGEDGEIIPKKRGRPKKQKTDIAPIVGRNNGVNPGSRSMNTTGHMPLNGHALPSVYEIGGSSGNSTMVGAEDISRLGMNSGMGYSPMSSATGSVDYRHDSFSPPYGMTHQSSYLPHPSQHSQHSQHPALQQVRTDIYSACGYNNTGSHYGHSPGYSPVAGSSVYGQSPLGLQNASQPASGGGPASSLCLTPPPTSPSLLDQPDFETSASMSTDTGSSGEHSSHIIRSVTGIKEESMEVSSHGVGSTDCHGQQSTFSNPNTPLDASQQQSLSQVVSQASPYHGGASVQSLFHSTSSVLDHSNTPTPMSQSSPYSVAAAQALPIDFSQHQTHQNSPGMDGLSPADTRSYTSPGPAVNRMKSSDIAAKSLSGLESLVDQIPSIGHNAQHQPQSESLSLLGTRSTSPVNDSYSPHQISNLYGVSSMSSAALYGQAMAAGSSGSVASSYCGSGSTNSYSPPSSLSLGQTSSTAYPSSNFSAESLASSSVVAATSSPLPQSQTTGGSFFSSPLPTGYGMTPPATMTHMAASNTGAIYNPYGAAYTPSPYSGFHVPTPRFPYSPGAYPAPSPYQAHSSVYHQAYPGQAAVFERWKHDHMDMRFGGGF